MQENLEIIYRDEYLVAINKPHGLAVHRSNYVGEADKYAMQELKYQIGMKVFPCHRLDRKTSGVLLFALSNELNSLMQQQFSQNKVDKKYIAIVRGFTEDKGIINYPLINDKGKIQEAISYYQTLQNIEIDILFGKFNTSRYSVVEVNPQTGRMHQIRKHFAHINHPIIGDRPHGYNKQNKLFKEKFDLTAMLLHAQEINFIHPINEENIRITADFHFEFKRMLDLLQEKNVR